MSKYKRSFGREENTVPDKPVPVCQFCAKPGGLCSVPVFVRLDNKHPAQVVCYKNYCLFCGKIQHFKWTDAGGKEKKSYAFFMPKWGSKGILTALRDFFLPREIYESDGKADVGFKVRLIRALLTLQIQNPRENDFFINDVYEQYRKENEFPN